MFYYQSIYPYSSPSSEYRDNLNAPGVNNTIFIEPAKGFMIGNHDSTLYEGYSNYMPTMPRAMNEQGNLLLQIMIYSSATHDLNLYLDVFPSNTRVIDLHSQYIKKCKELEKQYVEKYGPFTSCEGTENNGLFSYTSEDSVWLGGGK